MKHNLKTILECLNKWLNEDPATGLIPMTPMHLEIYHCKEELRERLENLPLPKWSWEIHTNEGRAEMIKEILGDEK